MPPAQLPAYPLDSGWELRVYAYTRSPGLPDQYRGCCGAWWQQAATCMLGHRSGTLTVEDAANPDAIDSAV